MKEYLKNLLGLSEKGAKDLVMAGISATLVNIVLMCTSGVLYSFLLDSLEPALAEETPLFSFLFYGIYLLVLVLLMIFSYYFAYNYSYMSAYQESAEKRISLAETIRKLPLSFFGKKDLSEVTTTMMTDVAELENAFSHFLPAFMGAFASTMLISVGLFCFQWQMALATLWVVPVSFGFCLLTRRHQQKFSKKNVTNRLNYDSKLTECIENVKDIKANNRKEAHKADLDAKLKVSEKQSLITELSIGLPVAFAQMILKMGIATSMIMGITLLSNNSLDLMTFLVFMVLVTRFFDPLAGALINLAGTFHAMVSVDRMRDLEKTKIQSGKEVFQPKGYDIAFDQVSFSYQEGTPVLNKISFTAKQGGITALVGPSGGGKSTALKLSARFWDIPQGKITIGGENIQEIEPETLLKHISIVFQDVSLFNQSVMDNIRIGKKDATDEEVMAAAKAAHCHHFIEKLPHGYETFIGENGFSLSGGERQRLSIARALLKDAPIILLDEATSSLDIESETAVQEALKTLTQGKTVLVIAHRMRTIASADKIVLLAEGTVAEEGNHQELMKKQGKYAHMVDLQMKSLAWKIRTDGQ